MEKFFPPRVDGASSRVEAGPTAENLDTTIKKKPKEDPVGLFLDRFGKTLDVEHAVTEKIDFSYLSPAQRAESMWAVFNNVMRTAHKLRWENHEEKVSKDEINEWRIGLGAIKGLYEDEEVKKVYLDNYQRHIQESESINGDLEKFKSLKKTISSEEDLLDDYARRVFGKRGKTTEIDRLLFKTSKNKLHESREKMKELLGSNAELRVLNQYENIKVYAEQSHKEGYMWLPSRRKFLEDFEEAALFGDPLLIFGESGTGKTELIRAASLKLTGELCSESGGKNVRFSDLIAKRDMSGNEAFYRFGPLGKAATGKTTTLDKEKLNNGRIFFDDEFNLRDESDQIEMMARVASWKPGRKIMMPIIDEEEIITQNFLACASVNLASEKYASGRKNIPLEVMRKFGRKAEVLFMPREEIFEMMQAALMDENNRMRAAKREVSPAFDEKEESRTVVRDGQEVKQNVRLLKLKEQEEINGKIAMAGGFVWRLSGAIDELNKSIAHQETVLKSKGEGQYLNKILIDAGKIVGLMKNYVMSEDKISLEQFVVKYIRNQFSEMKSFSEEDRELTKEFFAHFNIDLNDDKERPISEFEIMTPRDIGLLSPHVKYEKVIDEEPVLAESYFITPEGKRVEYQIEKFEKDGLEMIPGEVYAYMDSDGNKFVHKFLGINKETGGTVSVPYKKEAGRVEARAESFSSAIKTKWRNPETQSEQKIEVDFEKSLSEQKSFYKDKLNLEINEAEVKTIWKKNYAEIRAEMEKYGYDSIIIIPNNLPEEDTLNRNLIEGMKEAVGNKKKKVEATWQGDNFKSGGSFAGVRNSYSSEYRIVLTHSVQSLEDHPILKNTRNKNIMDVTGLAESEVNRIIKSGEKLPVDCEIEIDGQAFKIQAGGQSLEEYMVQQAMFFEKTGQHLDSKSNSYAWLLKSFSGSRVVISGWDPGSRQLFVRAADSSFSRDALGLRLSRSFSN